ncbi:MAG: hypothetical protein CMK59_06790 [Proteobacteria bacterium]|nr:hypothetical protein [Pseudomonadota bacterium]
MNKHRASQTILVRCTDGKSFGFDSEQEFLLKVSTGFFLPNSTICHHKWTEGRWIKFSECLPLRKVLNTLGYQVGISLRQKYVPMLTFFLCFFLVVTYLCSRTLSEDQAQYFVLGWAHVLLDDHWWSPWTSQFLHGSKHHILSNVMFFCFLGFQVERALGWLGTLVVLQLGLLGASGLIVFLGTDPVIGASVWIFALWGAVFMIGWRFEDSIPLTQKYGYGWWSFLIFVPVYVLQLRLDVLSHLGHLGGLLGGIGAVALLQYGHRLILLSTAGIVSLCGFDSFLPMEKVSHNGLVVSLPRGFQKIQEQGLVFWKSYPFDSASVEIKTLVHETRRINFGTFVRRSNMEVQWHQGFYELVVRCVVPGQNSARQKHCSEWLLTAEIQEPTQLQQLREKHKVAPTAQIKLDLAQELVLFGLCEEADKIFKELWLRDDGIGFEARKGRIWIRALDSDLGVFDNDKNWLRQLALSTPSKEPLRQWAAIYLYANGETEACKMVGLNCLNPEELFRTLEKRP